MNGVIVIAFCLKRPKIRPVRMAGIAVNVSCLVWFLFLVANKETRHFYCFLRYKVVNDDRV